MGLVMSLVVVIYIKSTLPLPRKDRNRHMLDVRCRKMSAKMKPRCILVKRRYFHGALQSSFLAKAKVSRTLKGRFKSLRKIPEEKKRADRRAWEGTTHLEFGNTELVSRFPRLLREFWCFGFFVLFKGHHFVFWVHYFALVFVRFAFVL